MKDAAGDEEYHVRLNNDTEPSRQRVVFCFDPQQDSAADASGQPAGHGCRDTDIKSKVTSDEGGNSGLVSTKGRSLPVDSGDDQSSR